MSISFHVEQMAMVGVDSSSLQADSQPKALVGSHLKLFLKLRQVNCLTSCNGFAIMTAL